MQCCSGFLPLSQILHDHNYSHKYFSTSFDFISLMVQIFFFFWLSNFQILDLGLDDPKSPELEPHFSQIFLSFLFWSRDSLLSSSLMY